MGASFPALRGMNRSNDAHGLKAGQTQYLTETGFRIARLMGEITVPEVRGERITHIRHLDEQPPPRREPTSARRQESDDRSEEHTSELQSLAYLVCRLLLEK